jgi:hypothetical protein
MYLLLSVFVAARMLTESLPSKDDIPLLLEKRSICYSIMNASRQGDTGRMHDGDEQFVERITWKLRRV